MDNKYKLIWITSTIFCLNFSQLNAQTTYNISDGGSHTTCSGYFYDSGGSSGNYGSNEDYTITFCSADTGGAAIVIVNFLSINIKAGDHLYVYDGSNISNPQIANFSNGSSTGFISSSGECLTFHFISN